MHPATLHYIYDPLCGWCYAAAPLVTAAEEIESLKIQMHGGGLFAGANRKTIGAEMRNFILSADARIAALSGQEFGDAYKNELLASGDVLLDSTPPTRAVLAAEQLSDKGAAKGLAMQRAIQHAHYVLGKRVVQQSTLRSLAESIGLNADAFDAACNAIGDTATMEHIRDSRQLMESCGGMGFPTFVLERNGKRSMLDHQRYYGKPQAWKQYLLDSMSAAA